MSGDFEFVVNLVLPVDVAQDLQALAIDGFRLEQVTAPSEDQTARFGTAEVLVAIGVVKGGLELVKLGVELWRLLRERAAKTYKPGLSATLSTPDAEKSVSIAADMDRRQVEDEIQRIFI
jgi:hypothetical protein